jgi:putative lipoic acid-binding regulatory protein
MSSSEEPSLIEYPCDFPIKIMGRVGHAPDSGSTKPPASRPDGPLDPDDTTFTEGLVQGVASVAALEQRRQEFTLAVLMIVRRHAPDFDETSLEVRTSRKNTYLSLTCTIRAVSRAQLDALYKELCEHPMVVMVL